METNAKAVVTADDRVLALFDLVNTRRAEISRTERPVYITGGQFRYSESMGQAVDIITVKDIRKLKEIYMFLTERSSHNEVANKFFGIESDFTWLGFTIEEWFADLKTRGNILKVGKLKAELDVLETRLDKVLTPELRRKMELDALEAELGA